MNDLKLRLEVADFVLAGAMAIDRNDLDSWLDQFSEDSKYIISPRDNLEQGYPIGVMHCDSKDSLRDRIAVLVHANKFNPHYDRHILGGTFIHSIEAAVVNATTHFIVVQTTLTGVSQLYCSGSYADKIILGERLQLSERIVTLDTFSVPNCMATPL